MGISLRTKSDQQATSLSCIFTAIFTKMNTMLAACLLFIGAATTAHAQGTFNTSSTGAYQVTCGNTVQITIDTADSFWQGLGGANSTYYISPVELNTTAYNASSGCVGSWNSTHVNFDFNLDQCGANVSVTNDLISFGYMIFRDHKQFLPSNSIMRYHMKQVSVFCTFNRTMTNATTAISPRVLTGVYVLPDIQGHFTFSLSFADSTYTTSNAPSTVDVDDFVYVRGDLTAAHSSIKIKFEKCYAHKTASALATDAGSYVLIENGCPKNSTFDPAGTIVINTHGNTSYAEFKFKSFVWNDNQVSGDRSNQNIFVTCTMKACRNDCASQCPHGYSSNYQLPSRRRRRREVDGSFVQTLMAGPMQVVV